MVLEVYLSPELIMIHRIMVSKGQHFDRVKQACRHAMLHCIECGNVRELNLDGTRLSWRDFLNVRFHVGTLYHIISICSSFKHQKNGDSSVSFDGLSFFLRPMCRLSL